MCCDLITLTRLFSFFYEICDCIKTFVCHKNHDDCSEAKFLPIFPTCIDAYCLINIKRQFITISLGLFLGPRSNWPFNNNQNVWKRDKEKNQRLKCWKYTSIHVLYFDKVLIWIFYKLLCMLTLGKNKFLFKCYVHF